VEQFFYPNSNVLF